MAILRTFSATAVILSRTSSGKVDNSGTGNRLNFSEATAEVLKALEH